MGDNSDSEPIVDRLRNMGLEPCNEAADMLDFFFDQMQMHSPKMDGQHSYRFRGGGWPMTHCKGPTREHAVKAAMSEVLRNAVERL